jgi:hypothetical protein
MDCETALKNRILELEDDIMQAFLDVEPMVWTAQHLYDRPWKYSHGYSPRQVWKTA